MPARYNIPYASGITGYLESFFYKDNAGKVTVHLSALATSAYTNTQTAAILPVGYRPSSTIEFVATFGASELVADRAVCAITVLSSGLIRVHPPNTTSKFCLADFSFFATP